MIKINKRKFRAWQKDWKERKLLQDNQYMEVRKREVRIQERRAALDERAFDFRKLTTFTNTEFLEKNVTTQIHKILKDMKEEEE